jgi:hypothetical protein
MAMRFSTLLIVLALAASGCGGEASDGHDTGHQHSGSGEHDHYMPGMTRWSQHELYQVSFYSTPAPPALGINVFQLGIRDVDGRSVEGATVTVDLSMPAHGHGSDRVPVVEEEDGGVYRVENVSLSMMGIWQIDITIEAEAGTDTVTFRFDV